MKSKVLVTREQLQSHKVLQGFTANWYLERTSKIFTPIYKIKVTEGSELMD